MIPAHSSVPVHRSILAVDIEQSSQRAGPIRAELREHSYRLLREAMTYAGVEARHCDPFSDRGDGVLVLIRPTDEVPKTFLLSRVVPELARLVADYNLRLPAEKWQQHGIRLRVAVHAGEVHYDGRGYFGEALNVAFRLLGAPQVKARLRTVAAPLIVVVSEEIYQSVVTHQYDRINSREYNPELQVRVAGRHRRGYVHVPADAFESLTADSATGAIVPPATPFFNQLERHLIQAEEPFDVERGLADLNRRLPDDALLDPVAALTGTEKRVLELIGEGLTNRQIAMRLFLAEKTVNNYVSSILVKLGLHRRTQAAAFAVRR
jgi:DNA-binding CsgD family transcriptional regulator/class 3 adenylate cyclase